MAIHDGDCGKGESIHPLIISGNLCLHSNGVRCRTDQSRRVAGVVDNGDWSGCVGARGGGAGTSGTRRLINSNMRRLLDGDFDWGPERCPVSP